MPIAVTCPGCKKIYRVKDEIAGKRAKCSSCGNVLTIPVAERISLMAGVKIERQRRRIRLLGQLPAQAAVPQLIRRLSVKPLQSDVVATLQQIATRDPASQKSAERLGVASVQWQKWWDANRSCERRSKGLALGREICVGS